MSIDREPSVLRQLVEGFPGLAWAHDSNGTLLCATPAWRAAAGLPPHGGSMAQAWLRLMPPYDLVRQLGPFAAALRDRLPYGFEHRLAHGPERHLSRAVPLRDVDGQPAVWLGTTVPLAAGALGGEPAGVLGRSPARAFGGVPAPLDAAAGGPLGLPHVRGARLEVLGGPPDGGAWYDAFGLGDGRVVLAVGQVTQAPSPHAIALLRGAVRGAALTCPAPDAVLAAADGALAGEPGAPVASALVALYQPAGGWLSYAGAGHPPDPLHDAGSGPVALGALPRGPLGRFQRTGAEVRTVRLRPGAQLLLHAGRGLVILLLALDLDGTEPAW